MESSITITGPWTMRSSTGGKGPPDSPVISDTSVLLLGELRESSQKYTAGNCQWLPGPGFSEYKAFLDKRLEQ